MFFFVEQEEITRVKELIFGNTTKEPVKEGCGDDVVVIDEPKHEQRPGVGAVFLQAIRSQWILQIYGGKQNSLQ